MAFDKNQKEYGVPVNKVAKRSNDVLLPRYYRTDTNKKFLAATLDQLTQPGVTKKINGYLGRRYSKSTTANDIFVAAPTQEREDYQLEPALVVTDYLNQLVFHKDYQDHINHISVLGGNVNNHERINQQELYSWDPLIDWDKFTNYRQYYWLPYGPIAVRVSGQQENVVSTYTVTAVDEGDNYAYVFTPDGLTRNPTLKLYRGQTYVFDISATNAPFSIKTTRSSGELDRYVLDDSSLEYAVENGKITLELPIDAPNFLYYVNENDANTGGVFEIFDIDENTSIDVSSDIIGKKNYTLPNGTELTNGMKLYFEGEVTPTNYATGYWYVEGVGTAIELISEKDLDIVAGYTENSEVLFDDQGFDEEPFSEATAFPNLKDYITINRASKDRNPWSRYNRWFHKDAIEASYRANGVDPVIDQDQRASRPIIEFISGTKLYNFGVENKQNVDLIDNYTVDVFSTIEGSLGYNVDGVDLVDGMTIIFLGDSDRLVYGKIFRVEFINVVKQVGENQIPTRQIRLVDTEEDPVTGEGVLVKYGNENQGKTYWFTGTAWLVAQQKTKINQPPLFDVFDADGISFSDSTTYDGSTFTGTKLFSYKEGTGANDVYLGFPLTYQNINNVGDIVFEFNFAVDSFTYKVVDQVLSKNTNSGHLKVANGLESYQFVNGWKTCALTNVQPIVRIYKGVDISNDFLIDVYDNINDLDDLKVYVYKNGLFVKPTLYSIFNGAKYKVLRLDNNITDSDILTIKCKAKQNKNDNGFYEFPINLQNNPLNETVTTFTLGEVNDHVNSIVENIETFEGDFPGSGNLRDLGNVSHYGTRFVQHSGPLNSALYHLGDKSRNVLSAMKFARDEYNKFRRTFFTAIENSGFDGSVREHVDQILDSINENKKKTDPFYLSDMCGENTNAANVIELTVLDFRTTAYPITEYFDKTVLSTKSVLVYLNEVQLIHGKDYVFTEEGFVDISATLANNDKIKIFEFSTTDGSFVPPTPTKLGLWPKYEPKKYLDDTYVTPTNVIRGHDGSLIVAFDDYRDDIILELEKRIYNNLKVEYDSTIFDIYDFIPGYTRNLSYSETEFNEVIAPFFYQWASLLDEDYKQQTYYDRLNPFTFNYRGNQAPDGTSSQAYWRGIYKWILDTDSPHLHPWEMLGYTIEPSWWEEVYGPAPYTKDNKILWNDLATGTIRQPGVPIRTNTEFARPVLSEYIPVDEEGQLLAPADSNLAQGFIKSGEQGYFIFGDQGPVETAWRRSPSYPFAILMGALLMQPAKVLGIAFDRSRIKRNAANQLIYSETNLRFTLKSALLPSTVLQETRVQTAGLVNYVVDYISSENADLYNEYKEHLTTLTNKLTAKIGGFTNKDKFKVLLDSKSPTATGTIFLPEESFNLYFNTSSPIRKVFFSGVILTKYADGYEVRGYDLSNPFFTYYPYTLTGRTINVGGISESFTNWEAGQNYVVGKLVKYNNQYYRCKIDHVSTDTFNENNFSRLPELPIVGGRDATLRKAWDKKVELKLSYGTKLGSVQEVVDFMLGYGAWLSDQGFVFDEFNNAQSVIYDWETSVKEFLFFTTQNWAEYTSITLSPIADKLVFRPEFSVVNDLKDPFYGYQIYQADGKKLEPNFTNVFRSTEEFTLSPLSDLPQGIFGANLYLVQKEHLLVLDNVSLFNDIIYSPKTGYRQERVKVNYYSTVDWNGGFDAPGFIYDQVSIQDWEQYTDYRVGDTVRYKEFYYSAQEFIPGAEEFDATQWYRLDEEPKSSLYPNWDYKAEQFTDFYDLDTDNFDSGQQKIAQHLIGYQKRQYLENIIKDDVSEYKFYQGMILDKGSQNSFNKLFDVLSASGQESVQVDEEWALRVGQYGASSAFDEIEFRLDETKFRLNPQPFELRNIVNEKYYDFVIRQDFNDVYVKPVGYNSNPWPVLSSHRDFLRTPGYVKYDQVVLNIDSLDDILTTSIDNIKEGDYVWCAFEGITWNIYRFTKSPLEIVDVEYVEDTTTVSLQFNETHNLEVGDIIGLTQSDIVSGFYKISSVSVNKVFFEKEIPDWEAPFTDSSQILLFTFETSRTTNIDEANSVIPSRIKPEERIWTDNDGNDKWAVWENNIIYSRESVQSNIPTQYVKFGKSLAIPKSDPNVMTVLNDDVVTVYRRASQNSDWVQVQGLENVLDIADAGNQGFGMSMAFSADAEWLAIGAPLATNVKTLFVGEFDEGHTYSEFDIVQQGNLHWQALKNFSGDASSIDQFSGDWRPARLITAEVDGTASGLNSQGFVSLYQRNKVGQYDLYTSFVSPFPVENERFGSKLVFAQADDEYYLAVSSIGYNSYQGRVYLFKYASTSVDSGFEWQMNYDRRYRGAFDPFIAPSSLDVNAYNQGDIVFYNYELYQANQNIDTTVAGFNPSEWTPISDKNILGYFPKPVSVDDDAAGESLIAYPLIDETVESVFAGDYFGYDFDFSADGKKLIIAAPAADRSSYDRYKGKFRSSIVYNSGDVVNYGGLYYKAYADNTLGDFELADWELLSVEGFKGPFDINASYAVGDIVSYDNNYWKAQTNITGDGSTIDLYNQDWKITYPDSILESGKVFVYEYDGDSYDLTTTLVSQTDNATSERFGEQVTISGDGIYLAVTTLLADNTKTDQGKVTVFLEDTSSFTEYQTLYSQTPEDKELFGYNISFMNGANTLVVSSLNGDSVTKTTFDTLSTTFDRETLQFRDLTIDGGRVDVYDKYNTKFVFGETLLNTSNGDDDYSNQIAVSNNTILVSAPKYDNGSIKDAGIVYSYTKPVNKYSWEKINYEVEKIDVTKIKKAFLYDSRKNKVIEYLDWIDHSQGKIAGVADQEIKYKTFYDPAVYTVGTDNVTVSAGLDWNEKQVGQLWWNLTTARFLENSDDQIIYRNTNWNQLYETASIDIYEWVQSSILPSEWDTLADTEEGLTDNISGTSLYGDSAYSETRRYDSLTQTFISTYYFWVRNKVTVPNVEGRTISAFDVSRLIEDPKAQGYKYITFTSQNSFSLANIENDLVDSQTVLSVQYWKVNNLTQNIHSEWKLVSNNEDTIIPPEIENKWINSLTGRDNENRELPDPKLPLKLKYGIENRPRQSMFINRFEALKQFIEKANSVLAENIIVDDFNLAPLLDAEQPSQNDGSWDRTIDTDAELRFVGTSSLRQAVLSPVIVDGRIVGADIINPGIGYINAPYITVSGLGSGAILRAIIDAAGRVTGVNVLKTGSGYTRTTTLVIRSFSVLVLSDSEAADRWSIYAWNRTTKEWTRTKSQAYDVSRHWDYIDWYATGYNQYTEIAYTVNYVYELESKNVQIGEVVKITNVGGGGWLLAEKISNDASIDFTRSYKTVGRQNGTIKFKSTLYNFSSGTLGYDGSLYDTTIFDTVGDVELKKLLLALRDNIFVDNLRYAYIDLFFSSLKYAAAEQGYLDWAFKTSFIRARHIVGELTQKVTYQNDNLSSFEDYINEVKPYKTKIREFVSNYSKVDNAEQAVTDFDLPPEIINGAALPIKTQIADDSTTAPTVINYSLTDALSQYPWKFWLDNIGFKVSAINIVDNGSGYLYPPVVKIIGESKIAATAKAYVANGRVRRIEITNPGSGYLTLPTVELDGGLSETGVAGKASVVLDTEVVRTNKLSVKFDRINSTYAIAEITTTETFTGTGTKKQFALKWAPMLDIGKSTVTVDGEDVLREDYVLATKVTTTKGYDSYSGTITFADSPANGSNIVVTYYKEFKHLSATDRIQYYYAPTDGQFGKDFGQLMKGVDYGGVNVLGLGFGANGGWDSIPWFTDAWDGYDAAFDDYIVLAGDSTYSYSLPYIPEDGEQINIYVNGVRIDDPYYSLYDGSTVQANDRIIAPTGVIMDTFVGDGTNDVITLPNDLIIIESGDQIIFRKTTSDGSFLPNDDSYDTQLSGGNLSYTTGTGVNADDILVDGDGFVTPDTSHAPEEVVPGQILDALAIKVFSRPTDGSSRIYFKNYIGDGSTTTFDLGQTPQTENAVIVKVGNTLNKLNTDYTIDWVNKTIEFTTTPPINALVSVISLYYAGQNILDIDYYIGDGSTVEFITKAPYLNTLGSKVLINGSIVNYELFQTDNSYEGVNRVGIRFAVPPQNGAIINYIITSDENETLSVAKSEVLTITNEITYNLTNVIGTNLPHEPSVLVRKNNTILTPPVSEYFTLTNNQLTYRVSELNFTPNFIDPANIKVYLAGVLLDPNLDYIVNTGGVSITLVADRYIAGETLVVVDVSNADYYVDTDSSFNSQITFRVALVSTDYVEVISFTNHDVLGIRRTRNTPTTIYTSFDTGLLGFDGTTYDISIYDATEAYLVESFSVASPDYYLNQAIKGGKVTLPRTAASDDYVWVMKNKQLLRHSIDYRLNPDRLTITFATNILESDVIDVMVFSDQIVKPSFAYMQFKDIYNRFHYKRLRKASTTKLNADLHYYDKSIFVEDASVLDDPNLNRNIPGIIEIDGERIEYFIKDGNTLTQLRRGTLGTGIKETYVAGADVINLGTSETIPYKDQYLVESAIGDGSSLNYPLNYVPTVNNSTLTTDWFKNSIPAGYGQSNTLDVFVGGEHLRKNPVFVHNNTLYPDSNEGDVEQEAQFSVNGTAQSVRLTTAPEVGTKITVIKKVGKLWNDTDTSLANSTNVVANFIKESAGVWPR